MRQQKQKRECPNCKGPLKRTIGAQSRRKFWECLKGPGCYRVAINNGEYDVSWDDSHAQA